MLLTMKDMYMCNIHIYTEELYEDGLSRVNYSTVVRCSVYVSLLYHYLAGTLSTDTVVLHTVHVNRNYPPSS